MLVRYYLNQELNFEKYKYLRTVLFSKLNLFSIADGGTDPKRIRDNGEDAFNL